MTEALLYAFENAKPALLIGFIVFLRVGAAMALLPAFGERSIPERIRLVIGIVFTIIVAPAVAARVAPLAAPGTWIGTFVATEIIAGLAIGIVLRMFVLVLQMGGAIAAQSTSLSQLFGGGAVDAQPAIGHLLLVSGLAFAVMSGLHVKLAQLLIFSYEMIPAGEFLSPTVAAEWGIQRIAHAFGLAFTLAAPFMVASLIYNVAIGVINKAMPQLMVSFVGAPAITLGGLILMFVSFPLILSLWQSELDIFLLNPFEAK